MSLRRGLEYLVIPALSTSEIGSSLRHARLRLGIFSRFAEKVTVLPRIHRQWIFATGATMVQKKGRAEALPGADGR